MIWIEQMEEIAQQVVTFLWFPGEDGSSVDGEEIKMEVDRPSTEKRPYSAEQYYH